MRGASVLAVVVLSSIAFGQQPKAKYRAEAEYLWSKIVCTECECKVVDYRDECKAIWASMHLKHPADLPVKETGCHCGPDCGCGHGAKCECTPAKCYEQLRSRAVKEGKPLIVGVGCEPVRVSGCLALRYDDLAGFQKPSVVVGLPSGKELIIGGVIAAKAEHLKERVSAVAFPTNTMPQSELSQR